jgi:hypothetical protein
VQSVRMRARVGTSRTTVAWRPLVVTIAAALSVVAVTGCGVSKSPAGAISSLGKPTAKASAAIVRYHGDASLGATHRAIALTAGEALKIWVSASRKTGAGVPTIAIGSDDPAVLQYAEYTKGSGPSDAFTDDGDLSTYHDLSDYNGFDGYFSDYNAYSDDLTDGELTDTAPSDATLAPIIVYTAGYDLRPHNTLRVSASPAWLSDYGAGRDGTWLIFVAPVTGQYQLTVADVAQYVGAYAVNPITVGRADSGSAFDTSDAFASALDSSTARSVFREQLPFFFADHFWPTRFSVGDFSDYSDYSEGGSPVPTDYGPESHRVALERAVAGA